MVQAVGQLEEKKKKKKKKVNSNASITTKNITRSTGRPHQATMIWHHTEKLASAIGRVEPPERDHRRAACP
jgi:hypothetical protein